MIFETLTTAVATTSRSANTACSPRPSRCRTTAPGWPSRCAPRRAGTTASRSRVDDVICSFDTLKTKGQPFYRSYYGNVDKAEADGERG